MNIVWTDDYTLFGSLFALNHITGNVGLGILNPAYPFHLFKEGSNAAVYVETFQDRSSGSSITLKSSRGTALSPSSNVDNDTVGELHCKGQHSTLGSEDVGAILVKVDGTPGVNFIPGRMEFYTNDGVSGVKKNLVLDSHGTLNMLGKGAFMPPRITTTERNNLTASDGMMIYNTDINEFQGVKLGAWVNLS